MKNLVPSQPIRDVLRRLTHDDEGSLLVVAVRSKVNYDGLLRLRRGETNHVDFDVADRILCGLRAQHLWWTELRDCYYECDISGPSKTPPYEVEPVECIGCGNYYIPDRAGRKYCSRVCSVNHLAELRKSRSYS